MLGSLHVPIGWRDLIKRTANEVVADDCFSLSAVLAYYFFLALFPALLFLVALVSFVPVGHLLDTITGALARVAPSDVITIVQNQIIKIAHDKNGGLLTLGMAGAIWTTSTGVTAIMGTLNHAYDIQEGRSWWRVRLIAIALTIALAVFIVISFTLVVVGPTLAEAAAGWFNLGSTFALTWKIVQWPIVFALVTLAMALIYYFAPDAEQEWMWITPGSIVATVLWLLISLGFRFYVTNFGSYNATYGAIGSVIVLLLWFYFSGLAVLVGAELNSEIEHASPYGKNPGEKSIGEGRRLADASDAPPQAAPTPASAASPEAPNCTVDAELPPVSPAGDTGRTAGRVSDWVLSGLVLAEFALLVRTRLGRRLERLRD